MMLPTAGSAEEVAGGPHGVGAQQAWTWQGLHFRLACHVVDAQGGDRLEPTVRQSRVATPC